MQIVYNFATGPLLWITLAVFIIGSLWRITSMIILARKKDMNAIAYLDAGYSMRSICRWLTPFATLGWQANPAMTVATFLFHLVILLLVLFAPGHATMWDYNFGVAVWALPEGLSDALTITAILCCLFFAWRRLQHPTVRFVTRPHDWIVLAMVVLPFVTAFLAKQHIGNNLFMSTLHVLSGSALIMAIPFTRLSHALFAPFSRAYMGSEFGGQRHCPDW